jgi:hypothetical protein
MPRCPRVVGFWINVLKPVHQRDIFGTQVIFQFFHFLRQLIGSFAALFIVGLLDLLTEFADLAVGLGLGLTRR